MSAPASDLRYSSVSSSGHVDGLGRRSLFFDRETGAMLERVHVRPELAVFEQIIRQRVSRLASIEEERFARPSAVERDPSSGELIVVAEFVTGSRLCELLDVSSDEAVVPGVDVALGYLLETLPALTALHTSNRVVHGLIDPSRTIVTAEGQVVFLDLAFGPAVELLNPTAHRLWTEFGVSGSPSNGRIRFDQAGDVTQVALAALMLVLGRNLRADEYPDALPNLLMEVIEVAQIRGTAAFAGGLQRILGRSLPIPERRPYTTADEMLAEVRQIVRKEIGLEVCRQAMIDFVAQMDAAFASASASSDRSGAAYSHAPASRDPRVPELDHFLDTFEVADDPVDVSSGDTHFGADAQEDTFEADIEEDDDDSDETELSLDQMEPIARAKPQAEEIYDLAALDDLSDADTDALTTELASFGRRRASEPSREPVPVIEERYVPPPIVEERYVPEPVVEETYTPEREVEEELSTAAVAETDTSDLESPAPLVDEPLADAPDDEPSFDEAAASNAAEPTDVDVPADTSVETSPAPVDTGESDSEAEAERSGGSSRRRKRQQMKSARARKDKLRSTTTDHKPAPPIPAPPIPPPPAPPKPASPSGWTVSAPRPSVPEPIVAEPPPVQHPPRTMQVPPVSFTPSPVGPLPQPTYASPSTPVYGSPSVIKPPPPVPPPIQVPSSAPLKIKTEPPAGFAGNRRTTFSEPPVATPSPERFSTLTLGGNVDEQEPRAFPWKLAAVAVAVAVIAIIAGRSYLPGRTAVVGEPGAPTEASPTPTPAPATAPDPKNESPIPAGKGRVVIQTQPPGIKVLLDRKPIGETPMQIDTTPGRHVLSFMTSGGEVLHSVRVVAGKSTTLDLPVFSGWVAIFAPILLDISENGRSLGTTEQNRLMMPPGRHELTLTNKEFGFSETRTVDIEPGGVRSVNIEARGTANINAFPWAEVWLDGTKLGETPLAGTPVPLGLREFVFKHPQHGERKVSATVRANAPAQITVDFTK
jgi:hypothetical protein